MQKKEVVLIDTHCGVCGSLGQLINNDNSLLFICKSCAKKREELFLEVKELSFKLKEATEYVPLMLENLTAAYRYLQTSIDEFNDY